MNYETKDMTTPQIEGVLRFMHFNGMNQIEEEDYMYATRKDMVDILEHLE